MRREDNKEAEIKSENQMDIKYIVVFTVKISIKMA